MSFRSIQNELYFEFGDHWGPIVEWDRHPAYRRGIEQIDKAGAVDVLGLCGKSLYFIEAKDYRFNRRKNRIDSRLQLESKVRNTVAGLLGACRHKEHVAACAPFVDLILNRRIELKIVFWYETPAVVGAAELSMAKRAKVGSMIAARRVENNIKWLDAGVFSTRTVEEYQEILPDLVVTSLPRRRRQLADDISKMLSARKVAVPDEVKARIANCMDVSVLEEWWARALQVGSIDELFAKAR